MLTLPRFRYHRDPVDSQVFVQSLSICPCCGIARGHAYVGPAFSAVRARDLCPWCIADGSAALRYDLEFVAAYEAGASASAIDELLHRTPAFFAAQVEDPWPVHCNDFCVFLGATSLEQLLPLRSELRLDLQSIRASLEISWSEFIEDLARTHSPLWAHLFQCLTCGRHRLIANYE